MEQPPCTSKSSREIITDNVKKKTRRGRKGKKDKFISTKSTPDSSAPPSKSPSLQRIDKKPTKIEQSSKSNRETIPEAVKKRTGGGKRRPRSAFLKKSDISEVRSNNVITKETAQQQETNIAEPTRFKGIVYRKRDVNIKKINLESFKSVKRSPVIFETRENLIQKISKLSIEEETGKPKKKKKKKAKGFEPYLTKEQVDEGLKDGKLLKGIIRINPKNPKESYIGNENSGKADYIINNLVHRNRALEGDEVIFEIIDERSIKVVYIEKQIHPRTAVGNLRAFNDKFAEFTPRDKRIPKVLIPSISWPNDFKENPNLYANNLFIVKIVNWDNINHADGLIIENLGLKGDLRVETIAILKEFTLDNTPFNNDEIAIIKEKLNNKESNLSENREDLRDKCIFTIDPATAKDLDDAVSCEQLPNGNYEVGVHISDVSYYLDENTILDDKVKLKATTIYLVEQVFHMLPLELCLNCSLLPNQDKYAFSVIWELTKDGEIVNKRITRSLIKSCCQLSYEDAQEVIDNPLENLKDDEFPTIYNNFKLKDVANVINNLQNIAVNLRQKRIDNGALRIDQIKISFSLDPNDGQPTRFWAYESKAAHRLIEEFMLLANITVAKWIFEKYPDLAFLRCHEPPKLTMLSDLRENLETVGIFLDSTNSGTLSQSLCKYFSDDFLGHCRWVVLNHLLAKPMVRARYFCAGIMDDDSDFHHYALSVPIYTHFTSPIRRYADIMVHRLLAASLGYREKPNYTIDDVAEVAENCNRQKYNAKRAGEASIDLYLAHYIENHQPFTELGVVVDCKDRSIDVIIVKTGSIVRLYTNNFEKGVKWETERVRKSEDDDDNKKMWRMTVHFPKTRKYSAYTMVLEIFSVVHVKLWRKPDTYKLEGKLVRPNTS